MMQALSWSDRFLFDRRASVIAKKRSDNMQKHVSHLIERIHKPAEVGRRRGPSRRSGQTRLLLVAVAGDRPEIGKSAAFHFPGWDEGSDTFDALAAIAGIVQETCLEPGDPVRKLKAVPDD
jgi:hypothetical protein